MDDTKLEQFIYETLRRGIHFAHREVSPATPLYIALEDRLRVLIFTSVAAAEVDIELRLQLPDGQVIPWRGQFFPTSNRASNSFEQDLAEGFLLDVSVTTPTAAVRAGACYVVVQVIRGTGANAIVMRSLVANYVTTGMSIGWPEGPSQSSVQGNGLVRAFQAGNPAAGAELTITVPTGARWLVQGVIAQLVASATVGNRTPRWAILDNLGNVLWSATSNNTQTAGQTISYEVAGGITLFSGQGFFASPIPDVSLYLQGFQIITASSGLQAGDQWQNIFVFCQEWIEQ